MRCLANGVAYAKLWGMENRPTSNTYLLIDARVHGGLDQLVAAERRAGKSWARLAAEVYRLTEVLVSSQTLRNWYPDGRRAMRHRPSAPSQSA